MKEKKVRKPQHPADQKKKVGKKVRPEHAQEQEQLFHDSDLISPASKRINQAEIIQTIGGEEINIDDYVEKNFVRGRSTHYFKELFYYPLAEMFGIDKSVMDRYRKPHFVAVFKNNFILSRFPRKVVDRIRAKNDYVSYCTRRYHHYQVMTRKADEDYRKFIWDVQQAIAKKLPVKQFIVEFCTEHKLPIQLDMFDKFFD